MIRRTKCRLQRQWYSPRGVSEVSWLKTGSIKKGNRAGARPMLFNLRGQKSDPVESRMQQCRWGNIVPGCQHCYAWMWADSGLTSGDSGLKMWFNVVDNQKQCCPKNIVASCFQQPVTADNFWPSGEIILLVFSWQHFLWNLKKH